MCQYLEDWHNSVNQYFPNDQCMLQNVTKPWMSKRFIQRTRQMDFNITKYEKFTDMISDSALQLTFKKPPLAKFGCSIKGDYL